MDMVNVVHKGEFLEITMNSKTDKAGKKSLYFKEAVFYTLTFDFFSKVQSLTPANISVTSLLFHSSWSIHSLYGLYTG